jgi:rare lipoprotein A
MGRNSHPLGRIAVGLLAFYLSSVLSMKPAVDSATPRDGTAARVRVENAWVRAQQGLASFYARHFDGRRTASGARFDNAQLVAAHPHLPFGTVVRVTNLSNGRSVQVRVVDRGPARKPQRDGVVIDLSRRAAEILDFVEQGRTPVRIDVRGQTRTSAAGAESRR